MNALPKATKWPIFMAGLAVSEAGGAAAAAAPSDVKAVAAEGGELTVDVSWTLPTVDADGQPLDGDRAVESVAVYRDGALAATLAAGATSRPGLRRESTPMRWPCRWPVRRD